LIALAKSARLITHSHRLIALVCLARIRANSDRKLTLSGLTCAFANSHCLV
jgi:hypothetical protein